MNSESESKPFAITPRKILCDVNLLNTNKKAQNCQNGYPYRTTVGEKPNAGDHKFKVDIQYGPISVCGVIKHRSERIDHIKKKLENLGFDVNLIQFWIYETVVFAYEGQEIFSCNIRNLSFKGQSFKDPVTNRVIQKLVKYRRYTNDMRAIVKTRGLNPKSHCFAFITK
ncbi:uncharacterized protein LOC112685801 [Sipha flava]|uniref:Uncharacterized protein LOC112685801 n=1 Tax=Sipha flava TaxID=143950 RepID=A0A8B8FRK9_9HEMI|nr:uncharacterized protein LOC112685801 [Sipha flava]XP_025413590.1 uncharacterized protein LOC112685801 [Sipha flava]XP_025413591.1 uncharacterized protein LOC112685801 [Sipha flava]